MNFSFLAAKSFSLELEEIYKKQTKLVYLRFELIIVPGDKLENNWEDLYNIKTISENSILVPKHNCVCHFLSPFCPLTKVNMYL